MAKVDIESVIEYLSHDLEKALEAAVMESAPDANVDSRDLFTAFLRRVGNRCAKWEQVPDRYVQA